MRFFALTTATADLPEVPDIQESLTAIQKFIKTASPCGILRWHWLSFLWGAGSSRNS